MDFWPNTGTDQPGCDFFTSLVFGCSHVRSMLLYAASIEGACDFQSTKCGGNNEPVPASCVECPQMGINADKSFQSGSFCLSTTGEFPFC